MTMRVLRGGQGLLLVLWTGLGAGCWIGDTPAPELPVIDLGTGGGCEDNVCDCVGAPDGGTSRPGSGLDGRTYRFTSMIIEEPYLLADLLNSKWAADLQDNILNVLFQVERSDPSLTGYPVRTATIRTASGWRTPADLRLPEDTAIESFCMIRPTEEALELAPDRACTNRCQLATSTPSSLNFFAGPESRPINCAPQLPLQHAIPLTEVDARFVFNEDCTMLLQGRLSACLERAAAEKICICALDSGSCKVQEPIDVETPYTSRTEFCSRCGPGAWISLSDFIDSMAANPADPQTAQKLPPCDPAKPGQGYKISGIFEAVQVGQVDYCPAEQ